MSVRQIRLPLVCLFLIALAGASLSGRVKPDLDRTTPVPESQPIPIQDFFRPRVLETPSLNPAGTHIAAIITGNEDKHLLLTYELATKQIDRISGNGDKDIYQFVWLDDRRLLYSLSNFKLVALGLFAGEAGRLSDSYPLLQYYGARLIAVPAGNRNRPLIWMSRDQLDTGKDLGPANIKADLKTGHLVNLLAANITDADFLEARENNDKHIITRYPQPTDGMCVGYLADKNGNLEFAYTSAAGLLALSHLANDRWTRCPVDLEAIDVLGCGNQPGQLVVLGPRQEGKPRAVQFMDAVTGRLGEVLLQDNDYDFVGGLFRDPVTRDVVGVNYQRNGPRSVWFDESYRKLQKAVDGLFPGHVARILDCDDSGRIFLVGTYSDREPTVYSWVDWNKQSAGLIKQSAPWIDPKRMQPVNILKFKTGDGRHLDAYLTLPAGTSKGKPAPLVVLPHGGPWVRDNWGFDGEAQFLASRGYAVLQPNYRGSPGYGWMFPEEDDYAFLKMHDDVTAATKTALASGYIDPHRVAIMGGSFGAYLALCGVTHEPDLYRCAVTIAGVFDWRQMLRQEKFYQYDLPYYARLLRKLGDPNKDPARFDAISPVRMVNKIRVPVFVAHGKDDFVADIEQSKQLVAELSKYNVPHETLFVGGEGHGMAHLDAEVELYERIEAFLAKNLQATN